MYRDGSQLCRGAHVLEKQQLNLSIIPRIHQIDYRISYTKIHGLGNLVVFFEVVNFEVFYIREFLMKIDIFKKKPL